MYEIFKPWRIKNIHNLSQRGSDAIWYYRQITTYMLRQYSHHILSPPSQKLTIGIHMYNELEKGPFNSMAIIDYILSINCKHDKWRCIYIYIYISPYPYIPGMNILMIAWVHYLHLTWLFTVWTLLFCTQYGRRIFVKILILYNFSCVLFLMVPFTTYHPFYIAYSRITGENQWHKP